tara:strand:+ start:354 stop:575 length:222 start_codon:yes stop_codon:yes gene_type:complete
LKAYNTILKLTNPKGAVINRNTQRRFEAGTIEKTMHFVTNDLVWPEEEYEDLLNHYPNMTIDRIVYKNGKIIE